MEKVLSPSLHKTLSFVVLPLQTVREVCVAFWSNCWTSLCLIGPQLLQLHALILLAQAITQPDVLFVVYAGDFVFTTARIGSYTLFLLLCNKKGCHHALLTHQVLFYCCRCLSHAEILQIPSQLTSISFVMLASHYCYDIIVHDIKCKLLSLLVLIPGPPTIQLFMAYSTQRGRPGPFYHVDYVMSIYR